ncbi:MAG: DegT/DnrJ/EryC1/StrS family aminotransferase [Xanthobacteraceae bacterium]|nr:DegT/DnrJ/EryC1/StrS family aminotransferase [Xanthobacteraceae bacterium]
MPRVGCRELFALTQVIARGQLLRYRGGEGGFTEKFENELREKLDIKHVLAVNSGTSALISALVGAGIGPGDEVLVPAYSWIATATAPLAVGAVPILVDIDESLTIDPEDIKRKITPYTKAIIPVHMLNLVANMDAIMAIAKQHRLIVIEDACQAVGVTYKGRRVGTIGDAGAFSFNQFKNLNAGEGGAILTNDDRIFTRARMYHDVGSFTREHEFEGNEPVFAGVNFRVSELTGAVLHAQLSRLDPFVRRLRKRHKVMYNELSKARKGHVSPHNDLSNAAALSMIFDTPDEAKHFARFTGVEHLIDTGRHLYTNWVPLLTQRTFDERMNPYKWAKRQIDYSADMCRATLDILGRTCRVSLGAQYPLPYMRLRSKMLLNSLK